MILIVSSEQDDHAQAVLERLHQSETRARRLDLSEFPQTLQLAINYDETNDQDRAILVRGSETISCSDCDVVWWRRPQPFVLHPAIDTSVDYNFAYTECQSAIDGLWRTLDAFWVNHPTRNTDAAYKVYQLQLARSVGFDVPTTLITNSPSEARAFVDEHGPESTVYKSFSATEQAWRETRVLKEHEVDLLDSVRFAPVIFQEYIPARVDLRITVMGEQVFAGAIHSQETEYPVDYRMRMDDARVEAFDLPQEITERIQTYMSRLGLVYGAIDVRLTPDGRFVFLEINPAGQWLFIERRTGQPMTDTFAALLAAHNNENAGDG